MRKSILFIFALILGMGSVQKMQAAAIYGVWDDTNKVFTLRYDDNCAANSGVTDWINKEPYKTATKVVLDETMKDALPTSTREWFRGFSVLETVEHLDYLNTSEVTDMHMMFYSCSKLKTADVSKFNTANVKNMSDMFQWCQELTTINVSNFNTANVENMCFMFYGCYKVTELNVSNFNTAKVTNMCYMFSGCELVTELNVSNFNTAMVTDMSCMFQACKAVENLDVSKFNTAEVTKMRCMFYDCNAVKSLNVSSFNTAKVTDMEDMFFGCQTVKTFDLSNFNTAKVTSMKEMFRNCVAMTSVNIRDFKVTASTNTTYMFYNCPELTTIYCLNDLSVVSDGSAYLMFGTCAKLKGEKGTTYTSSAPYASYAHLDGGASNPGYFSDPRDVVSSYSFTGFEDFFEVGMTWNSTAEAALAAQIEPETGAAYTWTGSMEMLLKWDQSLKEGAGDWKKVASGDEITYGKYYFGVQVRIEGANAKLYRMPKDGETAMTVLVDGTPWLPADAAAVIEPTYSAQWIYSPEFEFLEPEKINAVAYTGFEGQIKLGTMWDSDKKLAVAEAFSPVGEFHWTVMKYSNYLYKKNAADVWEEVEASDATTITAGTYCYEIWIGSQDSKQYQFPDAFTAITATVDGTAWTVIGVDNTTAHSWLKIKSPAFDIVDPAAAKAELKAVCDDLEAMLDFADWCSIPNDYTSDLNTAYLSAWAVHNNLDATYAEIVAATTAAITARDAAIAVFKAQGPTALKNELAGLSPDTDSEACKAIVTKAQGEVDKLAWDDMKSITENIAILKPLIAALLKDTDDALKAQRESETTTGIENPMVNGKCQNGKFIRDGQLYIIRDGKIYSILGNAVQ